MGRRQPDFASLLFRTDPNGPGPANERERVVADNLRRTFDLELDGIVRKGTNGIELIGHSQHDSRRIGSISDEVSVVGTKDEFRVNTSARVSLCDRELALIVSFEPKIAPLVKEFLQFDREWCVFEMRELGAIGIGL